MIRIWVLVVIITVISYLVLKLIKKPVHIAWVFLFWAAVIFGTILLLYGASVWFAGQ